METITSFKQKLRQGVKSGITVIEDVLKLQADRFISLRNRDNYNWNHTIQSLELIAPGKVSVRIYWQGDLTDGAYSFDLKEIAAASMSRYDYKIKASWDGHYERHGLLRIDPFELREAFLLIADDLDDGPLQEIEKRAREVELDDIKQSRYSNVWYFQDNREAYWNGALGVYEHLGKSPQTYMAMSDDELRKVISEVYAANEKLDAEISRDAKKQ